MKKLRAVIFGAALTCAALTARATGALNALLGSSSYDGRIIYSGSVVFTANCPSAGSFGFQFSGCSSVSPATVYPGLYIYQVFFNGTACQFALEPFPSDPSQKFFSSITINGTPTASSAATSYAYSGDIASWQFAATACPHVIGTYSLVIKQ